MKSNRVLLAGLLILAEFDLDGREPGMRFLGDGDGQIAKTSQPVEYAGGIDEAAHRL